MSESQPQNQDDISGSGTIKMSIIVLVGAIALVVCILLLAYYAVGSRTLGASNPKSSTPDTVQSRIAHPAALVVDESKGPVPGLSAAPAAAKPSATPAAGAAGIPAAIPAAAAAGAKPAGGEGIYKASCAACHSPGVAGAPKSGDKAAWAPRIAQGKDTLYKHAIGGFQGKGGVMPAKGGNTTLSDADVKSAVDYMIALNR
ncbi:MAG: c-type cytochrome [Usitatibacteraceae bacterium]